MVGNGEIKHCDTLFIVGRNHDRPLGLSQVNITLPPLPSAPLPSDVCGVVESVKAASDIYSPMSGEVTEVNAQLEESPDLINSDPYNEGV